MSILRYEFAGVKRYDDTIMVAMDMGLLLWLVPTMVAIGLLFAVSSLEWLWPRRRLVGEIASSLLLVGLPFIFVARLGGMLQLVLLVVQPWLLLLSARLIFGRLPERFLHTTTAWNLTMAMVVLAVAVAKASLWLVLDEPLQVTVFGVMVAGLFVATLLLYQAVWTLRHYRLRNLVGGLPLAEMPTVTLAIPARNETHALAQCLDAAVASDYPKLEILVLDDCSQDKTSDIIKRYAQLGVRFIQGDEPADGWLGKNQAFKTLAEHASGEYLIFAGVDTQLGRQSISKLVAYALGHTLAMVSVLPQRRDGVTGATLLWQLRYYWQIVLPITRRRVPTASQLWLIKRDALHHLGGFDAVKSKIMPEGWFARKLFGVGMYRFIVSNAELGVTTAKRWSSQAESALRYLYPTFRRQPMYVLLGSVALTLLVLAPFAVALVMTLAGHFTLIWLLAVVDSVLLWLSYLLVVVRIMPRSWLLTWLGYPFSLVQDLVLLQISMLAYEFGEVNWKGRNVCYPVVASSLPGKARLPVAKRR